MVQRDTTTQGGVAGKGKEDAVAVETKPKQAQETIVIEEGEKTLEDLIEEQRAKLHAEGKKVSPRPSVNVLRYQYLQQHSERSLHLSCALVKVQKSEPVKGMASRHDRCESDILRLRRRGLHFRHGLKKRLIFQTRVHSVPRVPLPIHL